MALRSCSDQFHVLHLYLRALFLLKLSITKVGIMAEEHQKEHGSKTASTDCGMFDFLKKKENDDHAPKEELQHGNSSSVSLVALSTY